MDFVLVPGLWLDGSSWDDVVPHLRNAGHRTHALTLPGMHPSDTNRSQITLRDHVTAVVEAIDAVDRVGGQVVLVGHSAGAAIAYAALDRRPDRVVRVVYVGGFPTGDGDALAAGYPAENGEVPLPPGMPSRMRNSSIWMTPREPGSANMHPLTAAGHP